MSVGLRMVGESRSRVAVAPSRRWLAVLGRVAIIGLAYAALNVLSGRLTAFAGVSMVYPASALGVVAALMWRWETAVAVILATVLTPWTHDNPPLVMAGFAIGNTIEALLPALVLKPRHGGRDLTGIASVVLWGCVANTLLNAVVGFGPQVLAGLKPMRDIVLWWLADGMAVASFGLPFILWLRPELVFPNPKMVSWAFMRRWRHLLGAFAMIVVTSCLVYLYDTAFFATFNWPALLYLIPLNLLLGWGGLGAATVGNGVITAAYLLTLGLESQHLAVSPLKSPEILLVVYGNLLFFVVIALVGGTMRSQNLWLVQRLEERWRELRKSFDATVTALAAAIEATDPYTEKHVERVCHLSTEVARRMNLAENEVDLVRYGAILHDVGKIAVPQHILAKPGPLDEDEMELMKRHVDIGAAILERTGLLEEAIPLVRYHEERWDGRTTGRYRAKYGLKGEEIPLGARIIAVTDAYDAMTSDRPYRSAMPVGVAVEELRREAGTQFDPDVVRAFVAVLRAKGVFEESSGSWLRRAAAGGLRA